ncbi:hypothetical protein RND81_12G044500 [Saponaria officinalis]|uniref:RNase H type-1 domain-containing protein n=1 Tax=Saponaria officinalis TaxID=3572 RepID=A0AAW1H349_SAPOF
MGAKILFCHEIFIAYIPNGLKIQLYEILGFVTDRHLSWDLLRILSAEDDTPWVCVDDFNEVLFSTEMKGGSRAQWQMNNFRDAVDDCGLRDVEFEGLQSRLDRAMGNEAWMDLFPRAKLFHLTREGSDHAPIKLACKTLYNLHLSQPKLKLFRFEQIWVGEDGCEETIHRAWEANNGDLMQNLRECSRELQAWKGTSIGKIVKELHTKRRRLRRLNGGGRSKAAVGERKRVVKEINHLLRHEDLFWRQRSRALWLKEGDKNTKYFHRKAGQRRKKNFIAKITDEDGRLWEGRAAVATAANAYFKGLFTSGQPRDFEQALDGLAGRVTDEMNAILRREYTAAEVTVLDILKGAPFPEEFNKTYIVLIPKKKTPEKMSEFRPISLCNVTYKLVSKDRVEWHFLERILVRMGFAGGWINRVMECVTTTSMAVLVNGEPAEVFKPSREVLSSLMRRAVEEGAIHGIRVANNAPAVSHLFFADDSILFMKANVSEAQRVKELLRRLDKTTVSFSRGTNLVTRGAVTECLGVRKALTDIVRDKLSRKLQGKLRSLASRFWWGSDNGKRKISWALGGMGFRDYMSFNKALLGKQAWRLLTNRDSLMAKVIGGKYFPQGSFVTANLGSNPMVMHGIRRRIGDGLSTNVWTDPWIPNTQTRRVLSPRGAADCDMVVADLMMINGHGWNHSKVRELFLPFEQERILSIRLGAQQMEEIWCWDLEKNGEYSVRSAYKAITKTEEIKEGSSEYGREKCLWGNIWKSRVLLRVKVFFWQLCNEAIATRQSIASRLKVPETACPFYCSERENCFHLVMGCGWTSRVWEKLGLNLKMVYGAEKIRDWVEGPGTKKIFENISVEAKDVVCRVNDPCSEMTHAMSREEKGAVRAVEGRNSAASDCSGWRKPKGNSVKVNVDATVHAGVTVGMGAVCRDSEGAILWCTTERRCGGSDVQITEAEAMLNGLREVIRRGYKNVEMESDCVEVIEALQNRKKGRNEFYLIIEEIQFLANNFNSILWSYVSRKYNRVAHELARARPGFFGRHRWSLPLTIFLGDIVESDSNNMN